MADSKTVCEVDCVCLSVMWDVRTDVGRCGEHWDSWEKRSVETQELT